jgi:hypothetical protein
VQEYMGNVLTLLGGTTINEPEIAIKKGATLIAADGSTTDPEIEALMSQRLANLHTHLLEAAK